MIAIEARADAATNSHPVCVLPVVAILIWAQRRARRSDDLKYATAAVAERQSLFDVVRTFFVDIDGLGLVLLAFAWCLILLPFSLEAGAEKGWKNRESARSDAESRVKVNSRDHHRPKPR